jgi:hypothetical protein
MVVPPVIEEPNPFILFKIAKRKLTNNHADVKNAYLQFSWHTAQASPRIFPANITITRP